MATSPPASVRKEGLWGALSSTSPSGLQNVPSPEFSALCLVPAADVRKAAQEGWLGCVRLLH